MDKEEEKLSVYVSDKPGGHGSHWKDNLKH